MTSKENLLRVTHRNEPEWVPNGLEDTITIDLPYVYRPDNKADYDAFGVLWSCEESTHGGAYPAHNGNKIKDIEKWEEQIAIPDIDSMDWDSIRKKVMEIDRDKYVLHGFALFGLFERSYLLLGMENALVYYLTEPEHMKNLLSVIADFMIKMINRFNDIAHFDIMTYGDDWGTQNNLFMPVKTWREIIKPEAKRIYDCIKEKDIILCQHSCGKIESIFGEMVDMGLDLLNPCQPCNDLANMKKVYGDRVSFFGGLDSQFVLDKKGVTTEEVRIEVRKRIDEMAAGGGYIAAPSHSVPYEKDVIDAMNDEISKYGRNFYGCKKSSK